MPPKGKAKGQVRGGQSSQEALAREVIGHYLSNQHRKGAKALTVRHFVKTTGRQRTLIYSIIKRYDESGSWRWRNQSVGNVSKLDSDPEFRRRFVDLYRSNPGMSRKEMGSLLGVTAKTVCNYLRRIRQEQAEAGAGKPHTNMIQSSVKDGCHSHEVEGQIEDVEVNRNQLRVNCDSGIIEFGEDEASHGDFMEHDSFEDHIEIKPGSLPDLKPSVSGDSAGQGETESSEATSFSNFYPKPCTRTKLTREARKKEEETLQKCLVCQQTFSHHSQRFATGHLLQVNCDIIFLLRTVLRIEAAQLTDLLLLSEGQNPSDWYWLCDTCQRFQDEASSIRTQLQELELRMERCRVDFLSEVKQSSEEEGKLLSKKGRRRGKRTGSSEVVVTERLRDLILKAGYEQQRQQSLVSFENGDKQAEQLARERLQWTRVDIPEGRLTPPKSGPEMEDDFDFHSEPFPLSPVEIDFSEPNPRELQNPPEFKPMESVKQLPLSKPHPKPKVTPALTLDITIPPPHTRPTPIICDICGKLLKHISLSTHKLQVHGVVMEGFTAINCDAEDCTFRTLCPDKLKIHKMKSHDALRPYVCMFCSKRFVSKGQLTDHEDIHRNKDSKPYACDLCPSRFAVKTYLYIHKRNVHKSS